MIPGIREYLLKVNRYSDTYLEVPGMLRRSWNSKEFHEVVPHVIRNLYGFTDRRINQQSFDCPHV